MENNYLTKSLNKAANDYFLSNNKNALEQVIQAAQGLICYFARLYGGG
jgi:hypothetical protein